VGSLAAAQIAEAHVPPKGQTVTPRFSQRDQEIGSFVVRDSRPRPVTEQKAWNVASLEPQKSGLPIS
jgi:hypothetical protein